MRANGKSVWWWWWLGVLVAGCSQHALPGLPSQAPTPSLLSFTQTLATPTPILRLLRTPPLRLTGIGTIARTAAPLPTPLPVMVNPPHCYETPAGSLWCLGLVRNNLTIAVQQIIIRVYLVNAEGTALAELDAMPARLMLAPGETSPYGVLFHAIPGESLGPVAVLVSAYEADKFYQSLDVRDVKSQPHNSGFRITGTVLNTTSGTIREPSLVITLFDSAGQVTGFRQWRWPDDLILKPGASLPFDVEAIPQGMNTARVEASVEGQRS
ncbi:MAG: hypothetical protein IT324_32445 [Anaerolineae bacterium]|nr:hypothetical protein [Anaerolineae bacterium]